MDQPDDFRRLVGLAHAVARELSSRKVPGDTYVAAPESSKVVETGLIFKKKTTLTTPARIAEIGGWRVFSQWEKERDIRTPISKYAIVWEKSDTHREVWLRFDGTLEIVDYTTHVFGNTSQVAGWMRHDPSTVERARLSPRDAFRFDQRSFVKGGREGNWRYYEAPSVRTTKTLREALEKLRKR